MNADEQMRLRVELLIDPAVLCPGPDLSAIKENYRDSIANTLEQNPGEVYGPFTDYHLSQSFSKIVTGTRPVSATSRQFRDVLIRGYGSWGRIELIAAQTPFYYGLSSTVAAKPAPAKAKAKPSRFAGRQPSTLVEVAPKDRLPKVPGPSEVELVRNILCRNLMGMLSDPNMVFHADEYDEIKHSISALVAETLLSTEEAQALDAIMMGVPVTRAYDMELVDDPNHGVIAIDVEWALRGT